MQFLGEFLWNDFFSHIYIEKNAYKYDTTKKILQKLNNKIVIDINHYKDVFSPKQNFLIQKNSPKLILAVKSGIFFYNGSPMCINYGYDDFIYTTQIMNCPYFCDYCYLQGLFPSANIVIFVNIEDTFEALINYYKYKNPFLCISYDTDLLALEDITGFVRKWAGFARENENISIELRTKSSKFDLIKDIEPLQNLVIAWSLLPDLIISEHEKNTPCLSDRLTNIKNAINKGWKIRLCFDPLLYVKNYDIIYKDFFNIVFHNLPFNKIFDICVGPFRMTRGLIKKIEKEQHSSLFAYPFVNINGLYTYTKEHINELYNIVASCLPDIPVYFYNIQ